MMKADDVERYYEIRRKLPLREISLGYRSLLLFPEDRIADAQLGYSIDSTGKDLVGKGSGDWSESWLVIAIDDLAGDPIFVDLDREELPVYTAAHGMGVWNPHMIASTFVGFANALVEIDSLAEHRRNPVELERNSISESEKVTALQRIAIHTGTEPSEFWLDWLESN